MARAIHATADEIEQIRDRLEQAGRKPVDLARALEVNEGTVSRWLSGQRKLPRSRLPLVLDRLHVLERLASRR